MAPKSMGAALVLTFLFGPLGLLYATVPGGLIMMVVSLLVAVVTLGAGLLVVWPITMLWAAFKVQAHNNRIAQVGPNNPLPS